MCKETKLDIYNISSWANTKCCFTSCVYVCATLSTTKIVFIMDFFEFSITLFLSLSLIFGKFVHNMGMRSFANIHFLSLSLTEQFSSRKLSAHYIKMHLSFAQASSSRKKTYAYSQKDIVASFFFIIIPFHTLLQLCKFSRHSILFSSLAVCVCLSNVNGNTKRRKWD